MIDRHQVVRAAGLAVFWFVVSVGSALAHNGEDHSSGMDAGSMWLSATGVVVVVALIFSLLRREGAEPLEVEGDEAKTDIDR